MKLSAWQQAALDFFKLYGKSLVVRTDQDERIISKELEEKLEAAYVLAKKKLNSDKVKRNGAGRPKIQTPTVEELKKLMAEGNSISKLAEKFGIDRKTVSNRLNE